MKFETWWKEKEKILPKKYRTETVKLLASMSYSIGRTPFCKSCLELRCEFDRIGKCTMIKTYEKYVLLKKTSAPQYQNTYHTNEQVSTETRSVF